MGAFDGLAWQRHGMLADRGGSLSGRRAACVGGRRAAGASGRHSSRNALACASVDDAGVEI
ncbi:MAG: hypothetical protein ABSD82_12675 [Solirubrobacteraceae bacterium]|jgi:hypothetical protein